MSEFKMVPLGQLVLVAGKKGGKPDVKPLIHRALDDAGVMERVAPFISNGGVTGRRSIDDVRALDEIMKFDAKHGGHIAASIVTATASEEERKHRLTESEVMTTNQAGNIRSIKLNLSFTPSLDFSDFRLQDGLKHLQSTLTQATKDLPCPSSVRCSLSSVNGGMGSLPEWEMMESFCQLLGGIASAALSEAMAVDPAMPGGESSEGELHPE